MTIHIAGTNQEIFDRVCAHLAQQGKRATDGRRCMMQTPDGLRCAIGGLLPDNADFAELDRPRLDIRGLIDKFYISFDANKELLEELQAIHDCDETSVADLRDWLRETALGLDLKPDAADQITHWEA